MSNGDVFLRVTFALRVSMMRLYLFFYLGVFLDYTVVSLPYSYRVIFAEWFLHSDSFACLQAICFRFAASFLFLHYAVWFQLQMLLVFLYCLGFVLFCCYSLTRIVRYVHRAVI